MTPTDRMKDQYAKDLELLQRRFDKEAAARVAVICTALRPRFNIQKVLCGMGTFVFVGDDLTITYDDDAEESGSATVAVDICQLLNVNPVSERSLSRYVDATPEDIEHLRELEALLVWWVDTTGGEDVDIP